MAVFTHEEQEQFEELKTWWNQHGNLVTAIVLAVALAIAGWQGWHWWQRREAAHAAVLYGALQQAIATHNARDARAAASELIDKYSGTSYAGLGVLLSAQAQFEAGDLKTAELQYAWAADHASDAEQRDLARLRLAAVLLDEKHYDAALKRLATEPSAPFVALYASERGDILAAQGKKAEAKAAYQAAVNKLEATDNKGMDLHREELLQVLKIKLESLGAGS